MARNAGPMFEFACHEGNHAVDGVMGGQRAVEHQLPVNCRLTDCSEADAPPPGHGTLNAVRFRTTTIVFLRDSPVSVQKPSARKYQTPRTGVWGPDRDSRRSSGRAVPPPAICRYNPATHEGPGGRLGHYDNTAPILSPRYVVLHNRGRRGRYCSMR